MAEIGKHETRYQTVDELVQYFKERIAAHGKAQFIGVFDHFAHTEAIGGNIASDIRAAVDVIFCFSLSLPNPQVLAVRPRSIGIAEVDDHFVVSFMEAPMQLANDAMEAWVKGLRDSG